MKYVTGITESKKERVLTLVPVAPSYQPAHIPSEEAHKLMDRSQGVYSKHRERRSLSISPLPIIQQPHSLVVCLQMVVYESGERE